jgi:hypothetical protein
MGGGVTDITPLDATPLAIFEPEKPTRETIERLEAAMLQMPQVNIPTTHYVSGGIYARHIDVPEGATITGAVHRKDHINVLCGDITVWTDEGMKRLTGYHILPTKAGAKRAGHTHSPTQWTTLVRTDKTDLAEIEADIVEQPETLQTRTALAGPQHLVMLESKCQP